MRALRGVTSLKGVGGRELGGMREEASWRRGYF